MISKACLLLILLAVGCSHVTAQCKAAASCLDCHTLSLCPFGTGRRGLATVNCSKTSLPYCDPTTGGCSATPSPACAPPDNFTCLSDGYFPDPTNCSRFHLCVDLNATRYECDSSLPSSYTYDVFLYRCTEPSKTCGFGSLCTGKTGVKVAHSLDKNLFAYCYNGSAVLQDRCPGNYQLDEDSQECEAVCVTEGLLPDIRSCDRYFRCISNSGGYWRKQEWCPWGQEFNPLTLRCEDDSPYCESSNSTTTEATSTTDSAFSPNKKFMSLK